MKLGLTGLPQSGKSTVFGALTGARGDNEEDKASHGDTRIAAITVKDERIDFLSSFFKPKKTTYAKVEYLLPSPLHSSSPEKAESGIWNQIRACDALLHVVRNFQPQGGPESTAEKDFWKLEGDMIINDLVVIERKIERIELDSKRGRKPGAEENELIQASRNILEKDEPLRKYPDIAGNPLLKGYTFLSAKPLLIIINNGDEDEKIPIWDKKPHNAETIAIRAGLEMEIAGMPAEDAKEFMEAYHINESALDRVIKSSYSLLNRISFFTVGSDEVKAWPISSGTPAQEAAGTVHTDMQKGFIRAEVLSFDDFNKYGNFQEAKKAGRLRLEGKEYLVKDGDIIDFRFNV
jgi:GTP-binding protein YchF